MNVLIPLAGEGTRLRPLTLGRPKPLLHVAGKPVLYWIFESVAPYHPEQVILVVSPGKHGRSVLRWAEAYWTPRGSTVQAVVQEEALGLGHAVWTGLQALKAETPLVVVLGDTIVDMDLHKVLQQTPDFIGVREVEDPRRFGIVWTDEQGIIQGMEEKPDHPRSNLAIAGVYGFSRPLALRDALHRLIQENRRTRGEYQLTDALQLMVESGYRFHIYTIQGWHDCGVPETLLQTHRTFLERASHIGRVEIRGDTRLRPPVYLPDGVVLENAHVGPFVSVGEGTVLRNSQVRHAILHEAVTLEDARVEYALVGGHVTLRGVHITGRIGDYTFLEPAKTGPAEDPR